MPPVRRAVVLLVALAALAAPPAHGFDAGPHTDMTRDALTSEGFGAGAANVGVAENWFVDYYWNASKNPFSGHAGVFFDVLSRLGLLKSEHWPQAILDGTNHLHFDSGEPGYPDLGNAQGVDQEWQRLMRATQGLLRQARTERDPLSVAAALGVSLHGVQDFYAHTNWVETAGELGSPDGPAWSNAYGSVPTYFDIPKGVRTGSSVYSAVTANHRGHGKWQTNGNVGLYGGMNKDWPGRPLYENAYLTAYFASRQWIQAARGWLGDDALWRRAQRLAAPARLGADLSASYDISRYSGHWQGSGEPCKYAVAACGELKGWAGSVASLLAALPHYQEDVPKSPARRRFERLAPAFSARAVGAPVAEPPSSQRTQARTRFVKLEVQRMRGYDWALGDPGPDDADLYGGARIRGQAYASTTIHDHDRFSFPRPYAPFTWIRSVPVDWRASPPVSQITVRVRTGDRRFAGTDDDVSLHLANGLRFGLEKRVYDDFERGDDDTYAVPLDAATRAGLTLSDLDFARIEKSRDRLAGGWFLRSFEVRVDGRVVASRTVNQWLEGSHRTAAAPITRDRRTRDVVPVWVRLDEDDLLYGGDDHGDVNRLDRNTTVALGYMPGADVVQEATGGKRFAGRLGMQNGEKGQVRFRVSTLSVVPPPVLGTMPAPTPTSTPPPAGTPTPTGKPDLVIDAATFGASSVTVRNVGTAAAGPFAVTATSFPALRSDGLAAGASVSFLSGHGCIEGKYHAVADAANEVAESDETNNTADVQQIC